ncbi:YggS family pyridoxal phosphate enzyme [Gilvibacter sp. SZ-19]|jgi:pyridoxal phosphate enzyme (YggS family)|uniref:YggS family pyridoxal phosphate-dependent enzyme n=1 Tax=Gilvibacter sp. SZ-19 TaxID=754429 RepID=UPI000B3D0BD9|nr:YggS family pyridoxal phosphate-dependent enzyme [Gilvibacter sp. SZ-19]ARV12944.1 YggS family pyridoxal phosphate enzyme [Gilvibacter sp. SZ-19]
MSIAENIKQFKEKLPEHVTLVAVSKTKPTRDLQQAYDAGQRIFGENKIQEMAAKWEQLPKDIEWHMIGHVQTNKVKYMAPFVSLIHAVDSLKLLKEINKQAKKHERVIDCLIQLKIASEESKFGLPPADLGSLLAQKKELQLDHIRIVGLMGMATFTEDEQQLRREFGILKEKYDQYQQSEAFHVLSMGMSGDYPIAIAAGSTMIRVGSAIFGARNYH